MRMRFYLAFLSFSFHIFVIGANLPYYEVVGVTSWQTGAKPDWREKNSMATAVFIPKMEECLKPCTDG